MSQFAVRELTHDTALDVLFQQSAEEQFEALRTIQDKTESQGALMSAFKQWFRRQAEQPYDEYYATES